MPNTTGNEFADKVAFVTGAASGIGRVAAVAFGRAGADVVSADVSSEDNEETARLVEQAGARALAVTCDVARRESVQAALNDTTDGTSEGRDGLLAQEPIGRLDTPDEVAATVLWLCSDNASFITGHALVVDGGQTA